MNESIMRFGAKGASVRCSRYGCGGSLTDLEVEMLPMGAKMMTLECGIRFLADYLNGGTYFRIHYEGQNLDRARTQFKLVADMENKWDTMMQIVKEAAK